MKNVYKSDDAGWHRIMQSRSNIKSVILTIAAEILNVIEFLPRRSWWVEDDSLGTTRRF